MYRESGCSPASYDTWNKKYGDATPDEAKRLQHLEVENERLLRIMSQQHPDQGGQGSVGKTAMTAIQKRALVHELMGQRVKPVRVCFLAG